MVHSCQYHRCCLVQSGNDGNYNQTSTSSSVGINPHSSGRSPLHNSGSSPALSNEVIPSKAEMTLVHLERRRLDNALVLNYIKVRSVHPATWGFY